MNEDPATVAAIDPSSAKADPALDQPGWLESSKEKVEKTVEQTAEYIQRNPYQALAIAAGIGFVAGLILKRR